ncbi:hypothetical protein OG948_38840 (plasmid) [Embleya sp. NBC_00888]|uniref:hypothetical protein n=1 Tax=Embleya sp. NBC_00888 TaxID=2975960 RepID=UPI002F906F36|nr:hypothetical protein OG948_38840 [Embleya sp. NBC_00888]
MQLECAPSDPIHTAIYLRCYPFDTRRMEPHHNAMRRYAEHLGLPEPLAYLDNGRRSGGPLPALDGLIALVAAGIYRLLLVPGPFVFSLRDAQARSITRRITAAGCDVIQLPSRQPGAGSTLLESDPAWGVWVGRRITLHDGSTVVVRMARREHAADVLWVVDARGTMRKIRRRRLPPPRAHRHRVTHERSVVGPGPL